MSSEPENYDLCLLPDLLDENPVIINSPTYRRLLGRLLSPEPDLVRDGEDSGTNSTFSSPSSSSGFVRTEERRHSWSTVSNAKTDDEPDFMEIDPETVDTTGEKDVAEVQEIIRDRRLNFFAANIEKIQPLLNKKSLVQDLVGSERVANASTSPMKPVSQPEGLRGTLKMYQLDGLSFLMYLRNNGIGGILADDMGLGKTVQTLALFQHVKENDDLRSKISAPFLVVCPLSVVDTWMSEIRKFTPQMRAVVYHGTDVEKGEVKKALNAFNKKIVRPKDSIVDIVLTSYETLLSDRIWFRRAFVWKYVVLDEGHRIKNNLSQRSRALSSIKCEFKLVLSGTPVQNDLRELWSVLTWLYPDIFGPKSAQIFEDAFVINEGKFDIITIGSVKEFLSLIMLRRLKGSSEVGLGLPPVTEKTLVVPLTDFQRDWYMKILTGVDQSLLDISKTAEVEDLLNMTFGEVALSPDHQKPNPSYLEKKKMKYLRNILMELRKVSIHPYLIEDAIPIPYHLGPHILMSSGKFVVLQKLVQHFVSRGRKVIIFSNFDQALNLCEDMLNMLNAMIPFRYGRLDGKTAQAWRNLYVYLFNNDERYKVFIISIKAGGEGLNLVSSNVVVFLDEDWNPQVMKQAESRVHRIGQSRAVEVFRFHSKGTIEEQMSRRLVKKAYMASKVFENAQAREGSSLPGTTGFEDNMLIAPWLCDNGVVEEDNAHISDLNSCDWSTVLRKCTRTQSDIPPQATKTFHELEKQWLARREKVNTNIFNGQKVDTSSRHHSIYTESIEDLSREARRIGKQRITMVDGYPVLKSAVEVEVDKKDSNLDPATIAALKGTSLKIENEETCFLCHGDDDPVACTVCPRSFHQDCLMMRAGLFRLTTTGRFTCPHHACSGCNKPVTEAGGLLYCCLDCERSYCEKCLDWGETRFVGKAYAYEARGYTPTNTFYINCERCLRGNEQKGLPEMGTFIPRRART